ncbi:hypothetical protein O6R05_03260 [Peptoniphilus equinus]|uniref:Uncharacterized protein n=1 Tax=Peptoniphilus equinus TaxID=3016343 RepID=A0ABY7QV33_9FIRM|nr:hypothetical protein [Peptoniphilus equinus]WBW50577.1 hypothetical protein O6R05_03260 [Peptoniphilus equinus]
MRQHRKSVGITWHNMGFSLGDPIVTLNLFAPRFGLTALVAYALGRSAKAT